MFVHVLNQKMSRWLPQSERRQVGVAVALAAIFVLTLGYVSLYLGWEWPEGFLWPGYFVGIILFPSEAHGGNRLLVAIAVTDIALYSVIAYVLLRRVAGIRD